MDLGSNLAVRSAVTSHENLNKFFHAGSISFLSAKALSLGGREGRG